jgi:CxxC motif-containing protein (DUF1111 family)
MAFSFKLLNTHIMKLLKISKTLFIGLSTMAIFSCTDNDTADIVNPNAGIDSANEVFTAAEWNPGGELGTTSNEEGCYSNPSPYVENNGMYQTFKKGETFFENDFTLNTQPRRGLGPAWVRSSCMYCHPSYGHGKRMERYQANDMGNGYLLVVYHPTAGTDKNGKTYTANSYISEVTGMPQTKAMDPFLAPIDENQIDIKWKKAIDEHNNKFPDGESYDLIYPDVTIPLSAFNTDPKPDNYEVRLESTIGIYGTALLDAIPDDSLRMQYAHESPYVTLNPGMWDKTSNTWASSAWYTLADGDKRIKKFTYALTRGSLQDGPGANAMWNITNVTRSDRHYLYTTKAWAKAMSENPNVIKYIQNNGAVKTSLLHPYYADGSKDSVSYLVNLLLGLNSKSDTQTYEKYFVNNDSKGEEMSDQDYYDFMVWHRGLAVPKARGLNTDKVKRGKTLFYSMGCTACHRPSWTTGNDEYWKDYIVRNQGPLPRYAHQKIWPYSDMVQHRLYMENDIRTGWCRTTPLWGRGLSYQETGAHDRLHDCRARNVIEAIMWHGYNKKSDAYRASQKFYNLPKEDRDAVVSFINAI